MLSCSVVGAVSTVGMIVSRNRSTSSRFCSRYRLMSTADEGTKVELKVKVEAEVNPKKQKGLGKVMFSALFAA